MAKAFQTTGRLRRARPGGLVFALVLLACSIAWTARSQTVLRLDGTLPGGRTDDLVATQVGPVYTIDQSMGSVRGDNLFHSFLDFSIGPGNTADFTSLQPFEHLFVRVTGGNPSNVNGTLRSSVLDGGGNGADVFLMNPSGILFGANAEIDVPGSLFLSTADSLRFDNGEVLDVLSPSPPVLSMAEPRAFGFLGGSTAGEVAFIENSGFGVLTLSMEPGTTLAAVGGDVRIQGTPTSFISLDAVGAHVALAGTGSAAAEVDVDSFEIVTTTPQDLGDVRISTNALVNGYDLLDPESDHGSISIRGGRLVVDDFGVLSFGGAAGSTEPAIDVEVAGSVTLSDAGFLQVGTRGSTAGGAARILADSITIQGTGSGVFTQGSGSGVGADVSLVAGSVRVETGGSVFASGSALASPGAIRIAADTIEVSGANAGITTVQESPGAPTGPIELGTGRGSLVLSDGARIVSQTDGTGDGSPIAIDTGSLEIRDGGVIESSTRAGAAGRAGSIDVDAEEIELTRSSADALPGFLTTVSELGSLGSGGDIHLRTGTLTLSEGAQVSTTTFGRDAGAIDIDATGAVVLRGDDAGVNPSGLFSRAETTSNGAGGAITIDAASIAIEDGAAISSRAQSVGGSGDIRLRAEEFITIEGVGSASSIVSSKTLLGTGGDVILEAPQILLADGAAVDLTTGGSQPGGRLSVIARDLTVQGTANSGPSPLRSTLSAISEGSGDSQGIDLQLSGQLRIVDGGLVTVRSEASGGTGDVAIRAVDVTLASGGEIEARAQGSADAGRVEIEAVGEIVLDGGRITTEAVVALGGDVSLHAGERVTLRRSEVETSVGAGAGSGGDVEIQAPFIIENDALVSANAVFGNGGNIYFTTGALFMSPGSVNDASSEFGLDGQVSSSVPVTDLSGQLAPIGAPLLAVGDELRRDCAARTERAGSFIITTEQPERAFDGDDLDLERVPVRADANEDDPCSAR